MKSFKITDEIEVICERKNTRNGFKHEATLLKSGSEVDKTKVSYLNRTWESYEYQSVLKRLIEKTKSLNEEEKKICNEFIEKDHTDWTEFKAISMIAKLGEFLTDTKEEQNSWKTRMVKAGLENKGLTMPEDWDQLSEDEKTKRLDLVINQIDSIAKK